MQELQIKKTQIEKQKKNFMGKVAHELREMRQAQDEAIKTQRQIFQVEFKKIIEALEEMKLKTATLKKEIKTLKIQKPAQKRNYAQKKHGTKDVTLIKGSKQEKIVKIRDPKSIKNL